jgi:hypothetical protein
MAKVTTAMLCDHAHVYEGKVSVLGGFVSTLNGPSFPIAHTLWFVARLDLANDDFGRPHVVVLRCEHEDGEQLARFETTFNSEGPPPNVVGGDPELPSGLNIILPLPLEFRRSGMYYVTMSLDGDEVVRLPLKPKVQFPTH